MNKSQIQSEACQNSTITARVPFHLKQRWQQAAILRGVTLTDFLIMAANDATSDVFEEEEKIQLSERDSLLLAEMLARPPKINERMIKAISEELDQMRNY